MPRALPVRRLPRRSPALAGASLRRVHGTTSPPLRLSDLVLALLAVALLGGLALMAAYALATGI